MKPEGWDQMDQATKLSYAQELMGTMRGKMIIAQALYHAIRTMSEAEHPEYSNIEDMEMLKEMIFNFPIELLGMVPQPVRPRPVLVKK